MVSGFWVFFDIPSLTVAPLNHYLTARNPQVTPILAFPLRYDVMAAMTRQENGHDG